MFKIESYVTPILLSYVDKYVRDFKPADAQVSLWGGGVALHNLVLKADVLQQEVSLPFTLVSGRIHELLIQVPWTKIMSEPIVVTIDTIECVLSLNPPAPADGTQQPESPSRKAQVVEAPPGYMQALVRRIVSNIALRVHHLIVKYVQDDIVLSLNVKHVAVDSAGINWEPAFADIDSGLPVIRRLVRLDDLTLCLDRADSDGKIRYYQEPLLYRCQLNFRVSTKLVSANTRRASSLAIQLRSSKLAFGVTTDQLVLLIRLLRERSVVAEKQPPPPNKNANTAKETPLHASTSNSAEPARQESWSEWAWSWLPTWMDKEGGVEEAPAPPTPIPAYFTAYLDDISLVYKIMELDTTSRKRARSILEFSAIHAAVKSTICSPTTLRVRFGARLLLLCSHGKCVCGQVNYNTSQNLPTIYMKKASATEEEEEEAEWLWPEENLSEQKIESAQVADEEYRESPEPPVLTPASQQSQHRSSIDTSETNPGQPEEPQPPPSPEPDTDELWQLMSPVLFMEYTHERSHPDRFANPYDAPPQDFEYSDWVELCNVKVRLEPIEMRICMGLIHRLQALKSALLDLPAVQEPDLVLRTLTVEENDALNDNLPQRRIIIEMRGVSTRVYPVDHTTHHHHHDRSSQPPLILDIDLPNATIVLNGPLYPQRVCIAACQLPEDSGPLFQAARLNVSVAIPALQFRLVSPRDTQPKPCARTDLKLVMHILLNKQYFNMREKESVEFAYSFKIRELNISGSAARLQAAYYIPLSLVKQHVSAPLKYTTLATDAMHDEEAVALDMTVEDLSFRGYVTRNINTHIASVQSAKVTAIHAPNEEETKQAWIFSAPETPTTVPYLRLAAQWCTKLVPNSFDYMGLWTEPTAFAVDPLFVTFLAYSPQVKILESVSASVANVGKSQFFHRRRPTPPSSGSRSGRAGAELVHVRPRSYSGSEPSEKKDSQHTTDAISLDQMISSEKMLSIYERLRHMLLNVEMGLVLVYVTTSSASALDCANVRDAMDRHAQTNSVLAIALGRLSMHSSSVKKHLWAIIRHDGPTFVDKKLTPEEEESFPWKLRLADMSCYTLETYTHAHSEPEGVDLSAKSMRSHIKKSGVTPRTVLELSTTTVTLSVVTKSMLIKMPVKADKKKSTQTEKPGEERVKYFKGGLDFKPTTLKEFVRGPTKRKQAQVAVEKEPEDDPNTQTMVGPVISLGVHIYADTPPVVLRIDHDQVHVMASTIHSFRHIVTLLQRQPIAGPRQRYSVSTRCSLARTNTNTSSLPRSVSEVEEVRDSQSESEISENPSELISIFEATYTLDQSAIKMKKLLWFQWVISRATLVVSTPLVKFAIDVDDIISTIDLQEHYNQLKLKLASASVKHYDRTESEDWSPGVLGGRVLEAREPVDQKEENHFLSVTITQAQISNLPASWKNELHPKMLERRTSSDSMWEIYATLAPLEAVFQPSILEHIELLVQQMSPKSFCPLQVEPDQRPSAVHWQWPFMFVTAGGLRLLVTGDEEGVDSDDTFVFSIGRISVNPHPENPIYRRPINGSDPSWSSHNMVYEGRQYEILIGDVCVKSARFRQIVNEESAERVKAQENPAVKWTLPLKKSNLTPVLHSMDISCVFAPAHYLGGVLACGPAVELNFVTDCALELSVEQLELIHRIVGDMQNSLSETRSMTGLLKEKKFGICPYANLIANQDRVEQSTSTFSTNAFVDADTKADSGIDTGTSQSTNKSIRDEQTVKKTVSVAFASETTWSDASDHLEVFVTMGMIELSLYVADDDSPEVVALRCPSDEVTNTEPPNLAQTKPPFEEKMPAKKDGSFLRRSEGLTKTGSTQSITDNIRQADIQNQALDNTLLTRARGVEGNLPLIHVTFYQPNLYYWRKKNQQILQISLFNAWMGLGLGQLEGHWHLPLLSTAKGVPDPVTDIRPALATMKVVSPYGLSSIGPGSTKGTIRLDVERPIQLEVSMDRLRRLKGILDLIQDRVPQSDSSPSLSSPPQDHILFKLRRFMGKNTLESVTIQTSQIAVAGSEGTCGWESASLQIASGMRPERVVARALVTSLLVAAGPPGDRRHVLLHPLVLGFELDATWEAWRRAEFGPGSHVPTIRASINLDQVTMDLRPEDLATLKATLELLKTIQPEEHKRDSSGQTLYQCRKESFMSALTGTPSFASVGDADLTDHYYKDDLRSGAFKIVGGGQLPMAYQVTVHGNAVSWRYPHPRAITRIVAFPLPGLDEEIDCVLELYSPIQHRWMSHTYFKLPVSEPREIKLYVTPPEAAFALTWRFRAYSAETEQERPVEFNGFNYMPREDPFTSETAPEYDDTAPKHISGVTAEELSGVLRVDSYFAPRLLPRVRLACLVAGVEINLHNSLPELSSQATELEGYYVSRPLMRSHRVLTLLARHWGVNCHLGSQAGALVLVSGKLAADILESSTGTIEELVEQFAIRGAVSIPADTGMMSKPRARVRSSRVHVSLHVPRVRTLHALARDWLYVVKKNDAFQDLDQEALQSYVSKSALAKATESALEGRVALWIHNSCGAALRVGQEGTDEVVPMGPGARLAYRWRNPTAVKRLRFAVAGPAADWRWSNSIPFVAGSTRVRLEESETLGDGKVIPGAGVYMYVRVEDSGASKSMHLVGRLTLANMLRHNLLYKVRARCSLTNNWRSVCSGELLAESVGRTVIAGADCDMVLKIKFMAHETGWSGDIPLKECPKENVPWLVKVPSSGDVPYTSVWCRVTRARSDGRVLATVWPLYVLHSHLPLDTDVMISTHTTGASSTELTFEETPPLIQTAPGRGACTHLVAPGTTSARHSLSFQYRNIDCPVTREAVPMHYGVTDSSVFDKRAPVNNIDEVIQEVNEWLHRSRKSAESNWPYSLVTKHYPGTWQPALLQPRCDVTVRYQAVRAGGGCSLQIQLCPVVLLCNAAPIALTLRAHDAAPLCKLEPGSAISLPSAVLKKPFFMSVEMGRETFVSSQLELSNSEPGRYGAPPPGKMAVDHSAEFAILCNQKVALLTMYYEIKEEINVLGTSSTYVILNRLDENILVSAVTMPGDLESNVVLRNTAYKLIPPSKPDSVHGTPLCRFWLRGRWRGSSPLELRSYICLALPCRSGALFLAPPAHDPVPVRLATGAMTRRAIALIDRENKSIPVVVTQMKQDGRYLISVARDPCPQFVVHNRTRTPLTIAQPVLYHDEPSTSLTMAERECEGSRWWCSVPPGARTHYSTPAHCARYPPPAMPRPHQLPFVTFAKTKDEGEPHWCPAVVAADGEQLLQLHGGATVKLRVHTHPHSTLLELQDVDHTDISASDIRRRLYGPFPSESECTGLAVAGPSSTKRLKRVSADEKLLRLASEPSTSINPDFAPGPVLGRPQALSISSVDDDIKPLPLAVSAASGELGVIKLPTKSTIELETVESTDELPILETEEVRGQRESIDAKEARENLKQADITSSDSSFVFHDLQYSDWNHGESFPPTDRARCVVDAFAVEVAATADARPLLALHADRVALHVLSYRKRTKTTLTISDVQIDNLQYDSGQFDFGVVASTRNERLPVDRWPALWNIFADRDSFQSRRTDARLLLTLQYDQWTVANRTYDELTEVEMALGPLALYVEDAYVSALVSLWRLAAPSSSLSDVECTLADERILQCPLRLRSLHLRPLDLTLTLHTAVRMYIALDQSPLRLTAFKLQDMMTSPERLTHALTVHYLSAAILGAGWVVGGLELLGAPGALASRLGEASGGVRGFVSATAAALLRSLSAWAGSLARNLDLLAGDEEHARRAAAARRRPPQTFMAGLAAGITNFAINILGAVGGLAHHPLVGVAVGETESGAAALRRGLVGALTKPLSATADLVAYAGHGLLSQAGWDPIPQPRELESEREERAQACWRRDCVRWCFRLCELTAVIGFEVLLDNAPLQLLLTHKFLVVADPESERILEMIDFKFCSVGPYQGAVVELSVSQRRTAKATEPRAPDEDDEYQITAAAMARVARYTGAESAAGADARVLTFMSTPARAHALYAALVAAIHHNADTHFSLL